MKSCPLDSLSDELLVLVLRWINPAELLAQTAFVSTRFASLLRDVPFWRDLLLQEEEDNDAKRVLLRQGLNRHQLQRVCVFVAAQRESHYSNSNSKNHHYEIAPACLELGSVLMDRRTALNVLGRSRITMRACLASTTDHINELVENLLSPAQAEQAVANDWTALPLNSNETDAAATEERVQWWSSAPTEETVDTTETLVFATKYPLALLSQICIKPLRDPYTHDKVYSWRNTTVKAYRLQGDGQGGFSSRPPPPRFDEAGTSTTATMRVNFPCAFRSEQGTSFSITSSQACIDSLLAEQTPVYESPAPIPCTSSDEWMKFDMPECGVVANVICLTLGGKHHRQWDASGYYACVERVFCRGIPLYTNADEQQQQQQQVTT